MLTAREQKLWPSRHSRYRSFAGKTAGALQLSSSPMFSLPSSPMRTAFDERLVKLLLCDMGASREELPASSATAQMANLPH